MFRSAWLCSVVVLVTASSLVLGAPDPKAEEHPKVKEQKQLRQLRDKLNMETSLENGIDANTPLKDALEFMTDRYGFTIIIAAAAFKEENVQEVENQPVQLPKLTNVKVSTVLRMLIAQSGTEAVYVVRPEYVEITTRKRLNPAAWPELKRGLVPTVDTVLDKRPLEDALRELAEATGVNVVLDAHVADKAKTAVSARLNEVPLDSAVRMLADMAGLKPVALDNALYVTTPENARRIQRENALLRKPESDKKNE